MIAVILTATFAITLLAYIGSLKLILRSLKAPKPKFTESLIIVIVASTLPLTYLLFLNVNQVIFGLIIIIPLSICLFWIFTKKFYSFSFIKAILVYIIYHISIVIISATIYFFTNSIIASPFIVDGNSMNPTLNSGDLIIVDKIDRNFSRNDIVVAKYYDTNFGDSDFVKRIIGLPNETVILKNGMLVIVKHGSIEISGEDFALKLHSKENRTIELGSDQYLLLNDNYHGDVSESEFIPKNASTIEGKMITNLGSIRNN